MCCDRSLDRASATKTLARIVVPNRVIPIKLLNFVQQRETEMRAVLRKAEIIDDKEDGQCGEDYRGDELPEVLQQISSRLE